MAFCTVRLFPIDTATLGSDENENKSKIKRRTKIPVPAATGSAPKHPLASAFWAGGNACLNRKEIIDVLKCKGVRCNNARAPASAGLWAHSASLQHGCGCVCTPVEVLQGLHVQILLEKNLNKDSLHYLAERSS